MLKMYEFCTDKEFGQILNVVNKGSVRKIDLSGAREKVCDRWLEGLVGCDNLEELDLKCCCFVTNKGVMILGRFRRLRKLNLYGCNGVNDRVVEELYSLKNLEELNLGCCNVTDDGIRKLKGLEEMRSLVVWGKGCTDEGLVECLSGMTLLEELSLRFTLITSGGTKVLEGLKRLRRLDIVGCKWIGKIDGLEGLEELILGDNDNVTNEQMEVISKSISGLRKLDVCNCRIGNRGLIALTNLSELEDFRMCGLSVLGRDIRDFCEKIDPGKIRVLHFDVRINDVEMSGVSGLVSLEELKMCDCEGITNGGIECLGELRNLRKLSLEKCLKVRDNGVNPMLGTTF